jgi:hypothetical protein
MVSNTEKDTRGYSEMKQFLVIAAVLLSGCSAIQDIKQYWPRDHDPVMFNHLVTTDIAIEKIDCERPDWAQAHNNAETLARYAEWRNDPQTTNMKGLVAHTERMSRGGSKTFCELGKKTAAQRIQAARSAWQGR